jgi:hypothetical protein
MEPSDSVGMPCGKTAVAKCGDCGAAICSDCQLECCGDSFCGVCYDYHATTSCVRKPVQNELGAMKEFKLRDDEEQSLRRRPGLPKLWVRMLTSVGW